MECFKIKSYHIFERMVIGTRKVATKTRLKHIFGKNLRYYRYLKGLTQEELAEYTNLNSSYMSELENGKYGTTFDKIELLSEILEVEPYKFFQETEDTYKELPDRVDMR